MENCNQNEREMQGGEKWERKEKSEFRFIETRQKKGNYRYLPIE